MCFLIQGGIAVSASGKIITTLSFSGRACVQRSLRWFVIFRYGFLRGRSAVRRLAQRCFRGGVRTSGFEHAPPLAFQLIESGKIFTGAAARKKINESQHVFFLCGVLCCKWVTYSRGWAPLPFTLRSCAAIMKMKSFNEEYFAACCAILKTITAPAVAEEAAYMLI